jgi:hypothetical protein
MQELYWHYRFLLAQLHMQSLARKITLKRVRESLKHLPEKLDDLYEEAMDRIRGQDRDRFELAHRLLCWITYAFEPLNMDAVQHAILAMDLDSDLSSVDNENVVPSDLLITVCAGLVVIDTESNIIRLVHHTTQEYFDRRRQTLFPAAQIDISRACVKYLLQPIFENGPCSTKEEIATRKIECPFFIYTARHWGNHARGTPESELAPLILKLLTNELSLASLVQGMTDGTYSGRNLDQTYIMKTPAISVVASFGLVTIVNLLLSDGIDITGTGSDESTPLHHAVWGGHLDLVKLLLQNKADIKTVATVDNVKQTALQGAASKGYAGIVRLLVEHGAEIEFTDENGRSALHHAAQNGHEEATRELLRSGADVAVIDRVGETPLRKASKRNNAGVVEVLTGHWKDTLTATRQSCMLLQYAAKSGDDTLFETFMLKLTGDTRLLKDG